MDLANFEGRGTFAFFKKFALFPVRTMDSGYVWLRPYYELKHYSAHANGWTTLYRCFKEHFVVRDFIKRFSLIIEQDEHKSSVLVTEEITEYIDSINSIEGLTYALEDKYLIPQCDSNKYCNDVSGCMFIMYNPLTNPRSSNLAIIKQNMETIRDQKEWEDIASKLQVPGGSFMSGVFTMPVIQGYYGQPAGQQAQQSCSQAKAQHLNPRDMLEFSKSSINSNIVFDNTFSSTYTSITHEQ